MPLTKYTTVMSAKRCHAVYATRSLLIINKKEKAHYKQKNVIFE